jgi:hypothetical protein
MPDLGNTIVRKFLTAIQLSQFSKNHPGKVVRWEYLADFVLLDKS